MKLKWIIIGLLLIFVGLPGGLAVAAVVTGGDALFALAYLIFDRTNGSLVSAGEKRKYLLHVPESYDPGTPTPLIVSMHGTAAWPAQQQLLSGWSDLADEEGFIVVYPSASDAWTRPPKKWRHFEEPDVQFISDLIAAIEAEYNIDSTRIYANGISFGGGMAIVLACRMPERFAAVGVVSTMHFPATDCQDARPTPLIALHGTADEMVPFEGGVSDWIGEGVALESIPDWAAGWARRNGCGGLPVESAPGEGVARLDHTECAPGAEVVLYTVEGGGHTWPGGVPMPESMFGATSDAIDATRETWAFFREHRLASK